LRFGAGKHFAGSPALQLEPLGMTAFLPKMHSAGDRCSAV
jgi:hypothetical protein